MHCLYVHHHPYPSGHYWAGIYPARQQAEMYPASASCWPLFLCLLGFHASSLFLRSGCGQSFHVQMGRDMTGLLPIQIIKWYFKNMWLWKNSVDLVEVKVYLLLFISYFFSSFLFHNFFEIFYPFYHYFQDTNF